MGRGDGDLMTTKITSQMNEVVATNTAGQNITGQMVEVVTTNTAGQNVTGAMLEIVFSAKNEIRLTGQMLEVVFFIPSGGDGLVGEFTERRPLAGAFSRFPKR